MDLAKTRVIAFLLILSMIPVLGVPMLQKTVTTANASSQPSMFDVLSAINNGEDYIYKLTRSTYYTSSMLDAKDRFISEYPDLPIWGRYNDLTFVPGISDRHTVNGYTQDETVSVELTYNYFGSSYTEWRFKYTFNYYISGGGATASYQVAVLSVTEVDYSDHMTVTIAGVSYSTGYGAPYFEDVHGGNIVVYIGDRQVGTVENLVSSPKTMSFTLPLPSFRYSMRHVEAMADAYYKMAGETDSVLDTSLHAMFDAVFKQYQTPYDLYVNGILDRITGFTIAPFDTMGFYDAHWFTVSTTPYPTYELGYYRLLSWSNENGYTFATAPGVPYPVVPYKSKIVGAAEDAGAPTDGGAQFLDALKYPATCAPNIKTDPLYYEWEGLHYAAQGKWGDALNDWYNIIGDWDGTGVKVCYSDHYSTVRLAAAAMLGTLLASHGYINWDPVDQMVSILLQLQWKGHGYYLDGNNIWRQIYKFDHKGGFIVAYDRAPDGSLGSTGFRPGITDALTKNNSMPSEYAGVIPTNAETTLVSLLALNLYFHLRG